MSDIPSQAESAVELGAFSDESLGPDDRSYYTRRWTRFASGAGTLGFNWSACVFGANWCLWRKQYGLAIGVLVAEAGCAFMLGFGYSIGLGGVEAADPILALIGYAALPIVRIPLGASANRLYLERARAAILAARSLASDAERIERIRRRGGTSPLALALGVLISLAGIWWSRMPAV